MQDLGYIAFVFSFAVIGAFVGFGAHFWRAHLTSFPEKISDGTILNEMWNDGYIFERDVIGAEWDENGYWSDASNRNLIFCVISGFTTPLIVGLAFWEQRGAVMGFVCQVLAKIGLHPPLC